MLPPDFKNVKQNPLQRYLWQCWHDSMIPWATAEPLDAIVVVGDVVEGKQPKSKAAELCLTLMKDQEEASVQIISPLLKRAKCKIYFVKGCLLPGHKVLTRDLRWVPVETLAKGDTLLAVTENGEHQWVESEVLTIKPVAKECVEVELEDGKKFRCTADHLFLVWNGTTRTWTEAGKLKGGCSRLARALETWTSPDTYKCAWLGGFLDGEGSLSQRNAGWGRRATLTAYQAPGPVLEQAIDYLRSFGFEVSCYDGQEVRQLHVLGGFAETVRALGMFRPVRLLEKFEPRKRFLRNAGYTKVRSVRKLGVIDEVVGLSTSSGTYIADGYVHHNTFYHDDELGRSVENVAETLRAEAYEGLGTGRLAREVLDMRLDGVCLDFSHGISVSGGLYRAVAIDREALWSAIAGKTGKAPKADVVVRAHAHYFVHVEHVSKHALILPAWQGQTSYMRKHSRYRMIPDIGAVILHIDPEAKRIGRDPCRVEKMIYDLPEERPVNL